MNSKSIRTFWNALFLLLCSVSLADLGEFTISEKLVRQIEMQTSQNQPFYKKGRLIEPNINIRVTPEIVDAESGGELNLNVNLQGNSRAHSVTQVTRNRNVQAVVDSEVRANFQQKLKISKNGLNTGQVSSQVQINVNNISVSNNFRLLNGVVNRKAKKQAPGQIAKELRQEKAELEQQIASEMQRGTSKAKNLFDSMMATINPIIADKDKYPFETKLSTKAGAKGQIKFEVVDIKNENQKSPKPKFANTEQLMATGVIHQDLLIQLTKSELAGKELKISQLKKVLCSPQMRKFMDFCKLEFLSSAENISLLFDKEKPIEFVFENGNVTLKLNAAYRKTVPKTDENDQPLLNSPDENQSQFETVPYQIEVKYKIQNGSAKLEKFTVTEKVLTNTSEASGKHSEDSKEKKGRPWTLGGLFNPLIKGSIQNAFKKLFAEEIDFHSASIPTKVKISENSTGVQTDILEAGSFLPVDVKAENGWLAVGSTFCSSSNKALGVSFSEVAGTIQSVERGSPADLTGFQPGDRIETFNEVEGRSMAFGENPNSFIKFIGERSSQKTSNDRKVIIKGRDSTGKTFNRVVILCPSYLNHKEQAAKGLAQFKHN